MRLHLQAQLDRGTSLSSAMYSKEPDLISTSMSVLFLSLAAGALAFIIGELFRTNWRSGIKLPASWGLLAGFLFAYLTELVLAIVGA